MKHVIKQELSTVCSLSPSDLKIYLQSQADDLNRLETVLDSLTEGLLVCDSEHHLIIANYLSLLLLPFSAWEGELEYVWKLINNREISAFIKQILISEDRVDGREFEIETKGIQRLLSISIFPLVQKYKITGSLIHIEDITEKRRYEARIRQMENLASLTTLAAGVAHEVKNPLSSISIHIQLLKKAFEKNEELYYRSHPEDRPDPNFSRAEKGPTAYFEIFNRYINVLSEETERLNHILLDFLFAVRPMTLNVREQNFNTFIREVIDFIKYELDEAEIKIKLKLDENLPLLDIDAQVMKQALINLIQNAKAAMEEGGTLTLRTKIKDNQAILNIIDTGTGIPEKNKAKIFEPYFTTKEMGSGLGLTLVYKIIREHRGEMNVTSEEGKGSCFSVILPIPQRERLLLPSSNRHDSYTSKEAQ